jgi:acyl carrier protein
MSDAEILSGLIHVLREHVQYTGVIDGEMDLQADLGLDSLQQLTFVVEAENFFAICFDAESESNLKSLNDVVKYIQSQRAAAPSGAAEDGATA